MSERTSKRAARAAGQTLRNPKASKAARTAAASALTQKETSVVYVHIKKFGMKFQVYVKAPGAAVIVKADTLVVVDERRPKKARRK